MADHATDGVNFTTKTLIQLGPDWLTRDSMHTSGHADNIKLLQTHQQMLTNKRIIQPYIVMHKNQNLLPNSQIN